MMEEDRDKLVMMSKSTLRHTNKNRKREDAKAIAEAEALSEAVRLLRTYAMLVTNFRQQGIRRKRGK
uniref:Uncharacterized protein n=1 Tax=viral metagenome TaxID=1070528 RepID=A0A6H2A377_9ZZZZ